MGVGYPDSAQQSRISLLASALRKEGRPVQNDLPSAPVLFTAQYCRSEIKQMAVFIVKFLCHSDPPNNPVRDLQTESRALLQCLIVFLPAAGQPV